jgi:hypothetical protein
LASCQEGSFEIPIHLVCICVTGLVQVDQLATLADTTQQQQQQLHFDKSQKFPLTRQIIFNLSHRGRRHWIHCLQVSATLRSKQHQSSTLSKVVAGEVVVEVAEDVDRVLLGCLTFDLVY